MSILFPINTKWLESVHKRYNPYEFSPSASGDRVSVSACSLGHAANLFGVPRYKVYADPGLGVELLLAANEFYGVDDFAHWDHSSMWVEDYDGRIALPGEYAEAPYIERHPFETPQDIEKFEVKDVHEISKGPTMAKMWKALETAERLLSRYFTPWSSAHLPYEQARRWLGSDKLLLWTAKKPRLIHELLRKVVEHQVNCIKAVVRKYGSCSINTGSVFASSEVLSPKMCREFHIAYLKEMVERALQAGAGPGIFYHICGDHSLDWRLHEDIPITSSTMIHIAYDHKKPMNLTRVIKVFGEKCAIAGNVPTDLILFGTPRQVYEEAKRQVLAYKHSPKGFHLKLTCAIPSHTPPVNVHALVRAVIDHGQLPKA
jgi:uroporphyrinogen decarboxylase